MILKILADAWKVDNGLDANCEGTKSTPSLDF